MADHHPSRPARTARAPSGFQGSPRSSDRTPIYREVPLRAEDGDEERGEDAPEAFWGHYVEDRLRHFSQESR